MHMKKTACVAAAALILTASGIAASSAQALTFTGPHSFEATCDGARLIHSGFIIDRDNTGDGYEHYSIEVTDGAGNVLFSADAAQELGYTYGPEDIVFPYLAAPQSNPLTVTVASSAGNGLPEQTLYENVSQCVDLPLVELPGNEGTPGATPAAPTPPRAIETGIH